MPISRNLRRKLAKRNAPRKEREQEQDSKWIARHTAGKMDVPSRHKVKQERTSSRTMRDGIRFQSGFKGTAAATGKEFRDYIPTFRVKDGTAYVSGKAWVRRGVR